jgi:spore coat protein U-like protein
MRRAVMVAGTTALFMLGVGVPTAGAAAPERETFSLDCDNGQTYTVAVNGGNGDFTPARIVGTRQMLVPTSFGDFNFMAVLPDGTVIEDSEPGNAKGGGAVERHINKPLITCDLEETFTVTDDPEFPDGTVVTFSTTVTAFITGR